MRSKSSNTIAAVASALVTIALLGAAVRSRDSVIPAPTSPAFWRRAEVARIQSHLAGAESLIAAGNVSRWSPAQRAARAQNLKLLRAYRERGIFPRNIDFADRREPYFVDDRSVMCAMAFLIAASGRHDIVDRIHATRNNARIRELADDTALVTWLDAAGLTVTEAARIQPGYDCCVISSPRPALSANEAATLAGGVMLTGIGVALNLPFDRTSPPRPWQATVGVITGIVGIGVGLGSPKLDDGGTASTLSTWNIAAGVVSLGLGIYHMLPRTGPKPAATAGVAGPSATSAGLASRQSREPVITIAPMLGASSGVRVTIAF